MLIDEYFKTIYLNYTIKETVPSLKKLPTKDRKEADVFLKKYINRKYSHNTITVCAALVCCKNLRFLQTTSSLTTLSNKKNRANTLLQILDEIRQISSRIA